MHQIIDFANNQLGIRLYPGQIEALNNYYESGAPNWLLLAGRRGGKSLLSDVIACYESIIPNFGDILRPGEDRYIIIVATRLDVARLHIRNISKLLKHTRALGGMIEHETEDDIRLTNGAVILALPCSARAGRGYTCSTLIFDELAHYVDSLGNASADAVYDALTPTVATFGDRARVVITTTPSSRTGIVYDLFDRAYNGLLPDYFVTKAESKALNPRISEKHIQNAYRRDPESAATEYGAEFRDPLEAFFSSDAIEACIDPALHRREKPQAGVSYRMAIDPATMKDRYGFAIAHQHSGVVILDYAFAMRPPVDPNAAEDLLFHLAEKFKPLKIFCDTASTVERLKGKLSQLEYTPFTRPLKLKIYGSLKEAINLNKIILYREDDLIDELKALSIRNGADIAAPKSGRITHDDLADCLALICENLVTKDYEVRIVPDPFYNW